MGALRPLVTTGVTLGVRVFTRTPKLCPTMAPILDHLSKSNIAGVDTGLLLLASCIALVSVLLVSLNAPRRQR